MQIFKTSNILTHCKQSKKEAFFTGRELQAPSVIMERPETMCLA
jgi:hypothetical protein